MFRSTLLPVLLVLLSTLPASAQEWTWPEKPKNLQSLPKDWPGSRLRPVMTGFTRALGVRCSHCHVGEEGAPLSTYDFASDEKPAKDTARLMLDMLGTINRDFLAKIETADEERVNMWCHTCHAGRALPRTLGEELNVAVKDGGGAGALARYRELFEKYYGRGAYDFENEGTLNQVGYALLEQEDFEGAVSIFEENAKRFPELANVYDSWGEAHFLSGNFERARELYQKSLELDPSNDNARAQLEKIDATEN